MLQLKMFKNLNFLQDNKLNSINIVKYQDKWSQIKKKLEGNYEFNSVNSEDI